MNHIQIFNMYNTLNSLTILASEMIALFVLASPNCLLLFRQKKKMDISTISWPVSVTEEIK